MKTQLGHYDIVSELGRGGMGVVYKGFESTLNRYVAIKVLAESLAHDESVKERFLREARSMASLNDAHIIQIYYIGDDAGQPFFVMEFVEGESLSSLLKRENKLAPAQAARIIFQTAQGLSTAHDKGVIHRDIKPGNLMISTRGAIKIADFGIALVTHDFSKKLTSTGEFVGTPGYLSPEVCLGKMVDQRSDIFSLGIVLFEMLTGRMPFTDESPLGLMLEVVRAEIPDVRQLNDQVDPEIARILAKMIAKEPDERYQSCHELVADLVRHPLLVQGGALTLQPRVSTAAATVFGMKTPVSAQRVLPQAPTPSGAPTHITPSPRAAPPPAPVHQPVLGRNEQRPVRRGSALPWAVAAIVLLSVCGGAFAFRDQIPFLKSLGGATTASTAPAVPAPVTPSVTPPAAVVAPPVAPVAPVAVADTNATANGNATATPNATNTANTANAQSAASVEVETTPAQSAAVATADAQADANRDGGPAPRASNVGPLKELVAARAAEAEAGHQQIAKNIEPPRTTEPAKPHVPTIAVIAAGDSAVADPAEQAIEESLARLGFNLIDQTAMPRVQHMLRGEHPDFGGVLQLLARNGRADVVVFVNAKPVGSQQMTYYGQSSTLYTVQLSIRSYFVPNQRMLGAGWNEQVSFTSLNAGEKAREAVEPLMSEIANKLDEYRARRGRRG